LYENPILFDFEKYVAISLGILIYLKNSCEISLENINDYRIDICSDTEFLQVSARSLKKDRHVKSHHHKPVIRETTVKQETWIAHRGKIKVLLYDINTNSVKKYMVN